MYMFFFLSKKKWRMLFCDKDLALSMLVVARICCCVLLFVFYVHLFNSAGGVWLFLHFLSSQNQEIHAPSACWLLSQDVSVDNYLFLCQSALYIKNSELTPISPILTQHQKVCKYTQTGSHYVAQTVLSSDSQGSAFPCLSSVFATKPGSKVLLWPSLPPYTFF